MPRFVWLAALVLGSTLGGGGHASVTSTAQPEEEAAARTECCFRHPEYAGGCRVTPKGDETCKSILAYLNNPASSGKTYCNSTEIRGGWVEVRCSGAATGSRVPTDTSAATSLADRRTSGSRRRSSNP